MKCVLCFTKGTEVGKKMVKGTLLLLVVLRTCQLLSSTIGMGKVTYSVENTMIESQLLASPVRGAANTRY